MGTPYDQDTGIPNKLTEWASTTAHITEPSEGKKDDGWQFEETPPSDYENWLRKNSWRWESYFNRLFADVIPSGVWSFPSVSVAIDGVTFMPTFTIGDFLVTSVSGKRLPFAGGTFAPTGLSAEGVDAFRMDAVCWVLDESANEWEWQYIEDVYGVGSTSVTDEHHILFFVLVENNANYSIYLPDDYGIIIPSSAGFNKNHIYIKGRYNQSVGSNYAGIIGIQTAINTLAQLQGGIVEVSGDWHGRFEWEWMTKIKMKSGVCLKSNIGSLITSPSSSAGQAAIDLMVDMTGYQEGTIDFPAGMPQDDYIRDTTDATFNFLNYGWLSMVRIVDGVNAGLYLIKETSQSISDPKTQHRTARLVDMGREPVTLTTGGTATYRVYLFRSTLEGLFFNATKMPIAVNQDMIRVGATYHCRIKDCMIESSRLVTDLRSAINVDQGHNYYLDMIHNNIAGSFENGIYSTGTYGNSNCRLLHNIVDVSDANAADANGIIFLSATGTHKNDVFGNICTPKGAGVAEQYNAISGWHGYPATEEHNEDGTHKDDVIGNDELADNAVLPANVNGRVCWVAASLSCKSDASDKSASSISREVQALKDETDESATYLSGTAFTMTAGTHPWEVRRVSAGIYQIRSSCMVTPAVSVNAAFKKTNTAMSIIPMTASGSASPAFRVSWEDAALAQYWEVRFTDDGGAYCDVEFHATFFVIADN